MLKDQIMEDVKACMRAKDTVRLGTLRMLQAALKQREVDERITLSDADVVRIVEKMIKQRREASAQFTEAQRLDLAEKENAEIAYLDIYLPQAASEAEIEAAVAKAVADTGAAGPADMGRVMACLKTELQGRADMAAISALVKARLS
ncbi:MAG: glutamyl-tRNA amidotransferase [Gammaproteobacteria bacterium RIFCSPHIGHO2_12_FULL_45_9]|nr:MAG: glutamyl-tRNA amidotransferase [Gammaproteobacteria bacterium RIFCSPHIGHO2_12_FULL_45_9]